MTKLKCTGERRIGSAGRGVESRKAGGAGRGVESRKAGGAGRSKGSREIDGAGEPCVYDGVAMEKGAKRRCDTMKKKPSAMEIALRKLNARARTEKEIRAALAEKECSAEEVEQTVAELKDYGYIDDKDYCKQYFRYSKCKGKADFRILRELEQKGIGAELGREAFEELRSEACGEELDEVTLWDGEVELDDRALARQVGERMARVQAESGREIDDKFLARVGRRLAGLGYDSGTVYQVLGLIRGRRSSADEWACDEDGEGC